jgi:hypothetical protein
MKRVHTAAEATQARVVRQLLEAEGIAVLVKGEYLDTLRGGIPLPDAMPTVWVLDDADEDRAREVLRSYVQGDGPGGTGELWTCSGCGEEHDGQFGACWSCGGTPG